MVILKGYTQKSVVKLIIFIAQTIKPHALKAGALAVCLS